MFLRFLAGSHSAEWQRQLLGRPAALDQIELVTDFAGANGVDLFASSEIDYAGIGAGDASWIAYDATLGPQLRRTDGFSVSYYGFNTTSAPFDDPDVRLAFAQAVDWKRMISLAERPRPRRWSRPGFPVGTRRTTAPVRPRCGTGPSRRSRIRGRRGISAGCDSGPTEWAMSRSSPRSSNRTWAWT